MTGIGKSENQETATSGMQSVQMNENGGNVSHEKNHQYTEEDLVLRQARLKNAINYMNRLITAGIDYSEAQWRVSQCYPQFSAEVIAEAYDQQFEGA